ncbi:alpha/beta hydrolase (plasmid) [Deinococcus taeanensis]|uniref:alpha/beta fold hydrolase n=1 Tax=Deinococcus taeanensis TaxID=2737050 RepID=UPI001CDBF77B|nr:alpha/beta hydrolase [Deinococcus taeanensis]UBV45278.1 alpha/beta hydrolase [Deinococcus taeanensis]
MRRRSLVLPFAAAGILLSACAFMPLATPSTDSPFLKRMQAAEQSHTLHLPEVDLHYLQLGQGPPVVMLPGGGSWAYDFYDLASRLATNHTVYILDTPGNGYTVPAPSTDLNRLYTLEGINAVLLEFMRAKKLEQADFIGNSWGGGFGLYFAERHPERVRRYVSLAGTGLNDPATFLWRLRHVPLLGEALVNLSAYRPLLAWGLRPMYLPGAPSTEDIDEMYRPYIRPWNLHSQLLIYRNVDWAATRQGLTALKAPTLVIWGEQDDVLDARRNEALWRTLHPAARVVVLPGAGHLPHQGNLDEVFQLIQTFLVEEIRGAW